MFNKKKCKKCRRNISDKYEFCPYCGIRIDEGEEWGMLGKNDFIGDFNQISNSLFDNANFGVLNNMLGNVMRMLEKEMQKESGQKNLRPKTNFELFINGKRVNPENIKITSRQTPIFQEKQTWKKEEKELKTFDKEQQRKFSQMDKEEPKTNVRRLSNKITYEIEIPGVKSIKDISILKLENSIEIKAIAKDKAYSKTIQINLPILDYKISKEKLVLELNAG